MDSPEISLRQRLGAICSALESGLVERRDAVRLSLLAALAGEHSLLIGPPGTAKSELARRLHRAFPDSPYFERLLTRFTVPEELFGPLSIAALEQDRYERQTAGFLPQAGIAFIDEVFKANSAILNALLTLLNEREFDNGAGRMRCPLISVVGATNLVPEDEMGEAFFDRFLLRLVIEPVSRAGFAALLALDEFADAGSRPERLTQSDLQALTAAARAATLPANVAALLANLRAELSARGIYVSDRRWVKIRRLIATAAAAEGRAGISRWDLWLLPFCCAAQPDQQQDIDRWLTEHLGVSAGAEPLLVTRVVEAFEAQLQAEREANDLDYDESGRLRFGATDVDANVSDNKGASGAMRMSYTRKRRYGAAHIAARLAQIDDAVQRVQGYIAALTELCADLDAYAAQALWLDPAFAGRARTCLQARLDALRALCARALGARAGFENLPRLERDTGAVPEPIPVPALAT
ncbi:MAG: AAA family ATPase [Rhodocyclaceae bacterium]|nr:AAA family ATPase [Rhodocyclaceae bacterium]MBX3666956.1 AAA family ATPase [Rhodocyclaceae bacterium]